MGECPPLGPTLKLSTVGWLSTHNTQQVLQRTIGPHAEVIYCRLVKHTQHTAGFTENNWVPHWSYLLSVGQVDTTTHCRFYREQLGPTLKLSTVGWSSRHNNTLQFYREQLSPPLELSTVGWSRIHNNTLQVLQRTLGSPTGIIYCRLVKYTKQHTRFYREQLGPHWSYLLSVGQVHNNTLQVLQRTIGPHAEVIYCRLVK